MKYIDMLEYFPRIGPIRLELYVLRLVNKFFRPDAGAISTVGCEQFEVGGDTIYIRKDNTVI